MEVQSIRLLITDVDGTLLNGRKELTQSTIMAIALLHDAGIPVALISARPLLGLEPLIRTLNIQAPCATLNGALIVDPHLGRLVEHRLPANAIDEVVIASKEHKLGLWLYTADHWYVSQLDAAHVHHEIETVGFSPLPFESLAEIDKPILKIVALSDDQKAMAECEGYLQRQLHGVVSLARSIDNRLEVTSFDANKGTAVEAIASAAAIPLNSVASVGDGENDILMFRKSGFSVAMGQAPSQVRRAATETTSSNAHDGLAWAIHNLILKRISGVPRRD